MPARNISRVIYDKRGKAGGTSTYTILPGGRSMQQVDHYPNGKTGAMVYRKME